MNKPAIQLYVGDLLRESSYLGLSLAAQGLWLRMLMLMHDACKHGFLVNANGMQMPCKALCKIIGHPEAEIEPLLEEMKKLGTFSTDSDGTIYCRRMAKAGEQSEKRRQAAFARWGCTPTMQTPCKPDANENAKHAPSSSSSSSSSVVEYSALEDLAELEKFTNGGNLPPHPPPKREGEVRAQSDSVELVPEHFEALLVVAERAGLRWSKILIPKLREIWSRLPVPERLAAIEGIVKRAESGEYGDPAFVPKLQRYLVEQLWTEKPRPAPVSTAELRKREAEDTFDKLLLAEMERKAHA